MGGINSDHFRSNPAVALEHFNKVIRLEKETMKDDSIAWWVLLCPGV